MTSAIKCFNCREILALDPSQKIFRSEECSNCYSPVRVCKMCQFYDTSYYNECREDQAERVVDKENANYCEYFSLIDPTYNKKQEERQQLEAAKALFRD